MLTSKTQIPYPSKTILTRVGEKSFISMRNREGHCYIKSCFSFAFNICYDYLRRRVRPAGNWRLHYSYAKLRSKVDRISQAAENQGCVHIALIKTPRPALHHATGSMGNNRVNHGGRPKGLAGTQALSLIKQDHFR